MSLLDLLREAQDEPARLRASPYVGPSILTIDQLRAMERALAHEGFFDRAVIDELELELEPEPEPAPEPAPAPPASDVVEPLPMWTPPETAPVSVPALPPPPPASDLAEPLPIWKPPALEPAVAAAALDPCPNCGEELQIDRIDLTINAGWLTCRPCGMRWGGSIDRRPAHREPVRPALLPANDKTGERGHIAAG
jgi:hypothetical protein